MKELLKDLSLTTLVVFYFFFCGGVYLYSFWSTFNFDPSDLITLTDVPKSFIYPLVKAYSITFIIILSQHPWPQ